MAASAQSTLENIERRRAQLQENVEKLRKALTHWTTWEAEYQALTEELESAEEASPAEIRDIAQSLNNSLLDAKEVEELLGKDQKAKRTANQVVDIISRRIDYVQQNSATIEKQLDAAEKQLAGVDVLLEPGMENEDGLPMMDIEEELDEQGNEVASSINQTGKHAAELVEVLRKAGLQKAEMDKQEAGTTKDSQSFERHPSASASQSPAQNGASSTNSKLEQKPSSSTRPHTKKTVSFSEDTKSEASEQTTNGKRSGRKDNVTDMDFTDGSKIIELEDDSDFPLDPVIPDDESPEDAELRRQMLQYGMSEVGQVVAQLNLDHPTAEYTDDEVDDDYGYGDETDDEDEDQYGRSTRPVVTDDYRKQMLELEKKLNARMMENVGPESGDGSLAEHAGEIRTMRIRKDEDFDQTLDTCNVEPVRTDSGKKGVRFADELDVSAAPRPEREEAATLSSSIKPLPTVSETIVERPASGPDPIIEPTKPAKVSKFKSARTGNGPSQHMLPTPSVPQAPSVPTGPTGRTLASTVVEHSPSASQPGAPDEFDPIVINRQIQTDYHKARNKFIQQQGGFKPTEEDEESPIVEERNGKTKKVSRFMASRLKAGGM